MSQPQDTTKRLESEELIYVKIHKRGNEILVAACDSSLLGKHLKDERFSVHINPEFYKGELVRDEVFLLYMRTATIANLFGKHTVRLAIEAGFIEEENVLEIAGVPHAQMVVM